MANSTSISVSTCSSSSSSSSTNSISTESSTSAPPNFYLDEKWKLSKKEGSSSSSSTTRMRRSSSSNLSPRMKNSSRSHQKRCAFASKCARLVKEQRARFYIMRRCVIMLICWTDS